MIARATSNSSQGLKDLSLRLGFRSIDGFAERVVYREFFPRGLTALDDIDEATLGTRPSMGHVPRARVRACSKPVKVQLNDRGHRRAANRIEFYTRSTSAVEFP